MTKTDYNDVNGVIIYIIATVTIRMMITAGTFLIANPGKAYERDFASGGIDGTRLLAILASHLPRHLPLHLPLYCHSLLGRRDTIGRWTIVATVTR